ncbi:catDE operon transcriptional regulator CatR [soil metagenome]
MKAPAQSERPARPAEGTPETVCPHFHGAVELIGRRWSGAILWTLAGGPQYFAAIVQAIPGLSDRLLSERLRELEQNGLIERCVHPGAPARVSYALTEKGDALMPALDQIAEWAKEWHSD